MLKLLRLYPGILLLGLVIVVFTSLGQTFLLAQFLPGMKQDLGLSSKEIGLLYSLATFISSLALPYLGRPLDFWPNEKTGPLIILALFLSLLAIGPAPHWSVLFLGLIFVRAFGQTTLGLYTTAMISRLFGHNRGKALAFIGLGRSIGEGLFPAIAVFLIASIGHRYAPPLMGLTAVLILCPLMILYIPKMPKEPLFPEKKGVVLDEKLEVWTWKKVIKDCPEHFIAMLIHAALPFILTGLFFHQELVLEFKGWSVELIATAFMGYGLVKTLSDFLWGHLIDKTNANFVRCLTLIPLVIALGVLNYFPGNISCYIYMGLLGISVGGSALARSTYWAENFGLANLGQIKAKDSSILVIGSAIAPALFGFIVDAGVKMQALVNGLMALAVFSVIVLAIQGLYIHRKS